MFLSSYEKLRAKLLQKEIISMAHLGARAFEEIGGEVVQTTAFILANRHIDGYAGRYVRLVDANTQDAKEELYLSGAERHVARQDSFEKIPGMPIAYWASEKILSAFINNISVAEISKGKSGQNTGDNERFLRLWYEVDIKNIGFSLHESYTGNQYKWIPYNKGGEFRRWYGNYQYVVNWENDGEEIKAYAVIRNRGKHWSRYIQNLDCLYKEGITWSIVTASTFSMRYLPVGFICDYAGCSIFPEVDLNDYLLALFNTKYAEIVLKIINPTINYQPGNIGSVPYIYEEKYSNRISELVTANKAFSRTDWDSYETSWDFQSHPLAPTAYERREQFSYNINADARRKSVTLLSDRYERWAWDCNACFDQLKANEEELNRIFIDIYGLADELTPAVAERDVTVTRVYDTAADVPAEMKGSNYVLTRADAVRSLISYAVGCMFGRYSLDEEGIVYAGGEWDAPRYKTFIPDADAIIPVCDDEYFIDDIAARFVSFVETVYGADTLEENLRFIADAFGGQGSPRTVIRSYFLRDFYADHVRRYRKRPIYWLFDSGEKNGFKALVYLHRYAPDTLARMRTDYIHPQQSRYQAALADVERLLTEAQGAERVRLTKRRTALRAQEEELHAYEERVHHLADQMIALDLDDGVRHNYALLQDVLAKLK